jgi:transcriptional regulatory protein LevR
MLTSNEYLQSLEIKAARKEKARKEAELRKLEAKKKKDARVAKKLQREVERA